MKRQVVVNSEFKILAKVKVKWDFCTFAGCREKKFEDGEIEDVIVKEKKREPGLWGEIGLQLALIRGQGTSSSDKKGSKEEGWVSAKGPCE